ncbi:MAG: glucoamylase family protein [Casimicrobium sp.]
MRGDVLKQQYALFEAPLRAELFSADEMEVHGKALARSHTLSTLRSGDKLLSRLAANETALQNIGELLRDAVNESRRLTPAGEWLLDNIYLIKEQIRTARRHFPEGYSRELPRLASGSSAGHPRVYDIALEAVAHGDGRVDFDWLNRFVAAYQTVTDLTLGELWAIPIMLRLALIENLRRVGERVAAAMLDRNDAGNWADQMIEAAEHDPKSLILVVADMARSNPPLVNSFVAELARRLQGHGSALALPLTWIEQRLSESNCTTEQLVQSDTQSLAANQVTISNSIGSLRLLSETDWRDFVESMSRVDRLLRGEPDGTYGAMDFATRDRYRHVVERIARNSKHSETDVVLAALELTHRNNESSHAITSTPRDAHKNHVGYFLIDKGLGALERAMHTRISLAQTVARIGARFPLFLYLGAVAAVTAVLMVSFAVVVSANALTHGMLALVGLLSLLASSQLAITLTNWLTTLLVTPGRLPRMDFSKGIAAEARTLVVVPTMLTSLSGIERLAEALEIRFLSNRDANLHFCLLTDFRDAPDATLPDDELLLQRASDAIRSLNIKYGVENHDTFFLFHRPRRWNEAEQVWMGYERKRGKLGELNAFLRDGSTEPFSRIVGETGALRRVKYIITLDTDTQLPRDAAWELVATMAHPLNRARVSTESGRVETGYGILQPRVAASLPSTNRSHYASLFGGEAGVDPYTRAVSDVYQDAFHEGSFIGKGIYDIDAFEQSLAHRFPENRILSHDLLEGCYARAGLLSDVQLYEDFPSTYLADVARRHRWIRGDWQIASWLWRRVPGADGRPVKNPLSFLSQWKVFDNLRRSLVPVALVALFLLGWAFAESPVYWTLAALSVVLIPPLLTSLVELIRKPRDVLLVQHLSGVFRDAGHKIVQALFGLACLPFEAWFSVDAIVRTSLRVLLSHRRLLEWNPSSDSATQSNNGGQLAEILSVWRTMWIGPALAGIATLYLALGRPQALVAAGPLLLLWLVAPPLVWFISRPLVRKAVALQAEQTVFLRKLARRTWRFFDAFVTEKDHWLPPDNYQEQPVDVVAHRTSPTNMGLALLANLSAYDFGYQSVGKVIERTEHAFQTMHSMERYQGHFYNWYDTETLAPLQPLYVSSVDSGNLSGHLLTLSPGLFALVDAKIINARTFEGVSDALSNLQDAKAGGLSYEITQLQSDIETAVSNSPTTIDSTHRVLTQLMRSASAVTQVDRISTTGVSSRQTEQEVWVNAIRLQCQDALDELTYLAPWTQIASAPLGLHEWLHEIPNVAANPTLRQLSTLDASVARWLKSKLPSINGESERSWLAELQLAVNEASHRAQERIRTLERLAEESRTLAVVDYSVVYDAARRLMVVGYNVDQRRRDTGFYDLLATEARLTSFVAIAQGAVPQESWFALGRLLTVVGKDAILLSWSGSMFEYLMPLLVMPTYENTLLDQTCHAAVRQQIAYGKQRGVPWGVSESGYHAFDGNLNYQYRAFGVPGLGIKRGLAEDLVIAPYASAMALMVMPEAACANLQRLAAEGVMGEYGLFEAVDYTPARLPHKRQSAIVHSYMAHHQGMSLLSLAYLLLDRPMQKRFESDRQFQATTLLLQERIPAPTAVHLPMREFSDIPAGLIGPQMPMRVLTNANTPIPEVQLLSNGRYHVMVTNAGGSYSRWKDLAVTRWREDGTADNWGAFCYLRDATTGEFWSTAHQPTGKLADSYEAIFSEGRAEFRRLDHEYETHTEIVVSPEDDIELRRLHITNRSRTRRTIEVTTYSEVVLAPAAADALHTAFSNLFVQTEIIHGQQAILCVRRPRAIDERTPTLFHLAAVHGADVTAASYETDRMRFIGRTRSVESPSAMTANFHGIDGQLSNSEGSVLDPIVSIRYRITLDPHQLVTIDVVTGVSETREAALTLVGKYRDRNLADRVFDLAWTHSWVNLRQINATESDAQLYARLAGSIVYANPSMRALEGVLARNLRGQSSLWGYAISGDLPIVLLQIGDVENIGLVRQLVQAHAYWRLKGLAVDLVIWNEDHGGYRQLLQEQILGLIAAGNDANLANRPGGIFVRVADQISAEDRILFQTVARIVLSDKRGTLADQVNRRASLDLRAAPPPRLIPRSPPARTVEPPVAATAQQNSAQFSNGYGGFSTDGREYVICATPDQPTPAPWVNVIANAQFGTVISESGAAYTWSENAHEFRFTPWSNDPVSDSTGEAIYIRDEESGRFWSPTLLPCGGNAGAANLTRHGFGYSVFEHEEDGIKSILTVYVDTEAATKFSVLKILNKSGRSRQLSATGYVEWVLGDLRAKSAMYVVTEIESASGAICARNPYSPEFADRIVFFDADEATKAVNVTVTGDRSEFIGRSGTLKSPAAMGRIRLSNKVGAGLDPCAAIQVPFALADGHEREIVFRLGAAGRGGRQDTGERVLNLRGSGAAHNSLATVREYWSDTLGAVQVDTPDPALNVLANGWLLYQVISCRLWARSGFYQSGGAFGFRDQLQDAMALVHAEPMMLRSQILLCASRQFTEGDVQHWWHPPSGRGVRTHCSDDFLWLAQATCRYVQSTGDSAVLEEMVSSLEGRAVNPEDDSYYDLPIRSATKTSLYQHCVRAILRGLRFGEHGLPLMGSGDWNDGMNLVGMQGKGESVWLAFFLYDTLTKFTDLARDYGDATFADRCKTEADQLQRNIEQHAWDGDWYRRAYFDDGTPLGSGINPECQIDSISQSWSVLSGAGETTRSHTAMSSLNQRLVRRDAALIQLLDPPFDKSALNPGYIKGYLPGVRENGGQYTHGAIWAAMAFAALGDRTRTWELFNMINPINHGGSEEAIAAYKVEPYVVAADVYAVAPHTGRGGWTWYTGSAGWMYRFVLESMLGVQIHAHKLSFKPCLPPDWDGFSLRYRHHDTLYSISVRQLAMAGSGTSVTRVLIDGIEQPEPYLTLVDDRQDHDVEIRISTGSVGRVEAAV